MFRDLAFAFAVIAVIGSMVVPLPPALVDFLLVGNLLLALLLLLSSLYISDPLKLSSLPTILLLATLYRLSLNISTTRLILGSGEAGELITAFGAAVIQGNVIVGAIVFLVITIVQFLVIAKGAERVAEVSARFTLDALPGKQMSIDADVRAGLIDFQTARSKREDLQTESRFYGALDGAMKFVKGDAIAGILITSVNVVGGFAIGSMVGDLSFGDAVRMYTLLSVGDGLCSQIPALLNAVAAGIVITRVVRGEGSRLVDELISQIGQLARVKVFIGVGFLGVALLPGVPILPFLVFSGALLISAVVSEASKPKEIESNEFKPRAPAVLEVCFNEALGQMLFETKGFRVALESFRTEAFQFSGLVLAAPDVRLVPDLENDFEIRTRGIIAFSGSFESEEKVEREKEIVLALKSVLLEYTTEFVDDICTRRTLDYFDPFAPELISTLIPSQISVTQLSKILRELLSEGVSVRNFDLILQAIAEHAPQAQGERELLAEVRIQLKRVISETFDLTEGKLLVATIEPAIDLILAEAERAGSIIEPDLISKISVTVSETDAQVIICSKTSRFILRDLLRACGNFIPVIAYDEVIESVSIEEIVRVNFKNDEERNRAIEQVAA